MKYLILVTFSTAVCLSTISCNQTNPAVRKVNFTPERIFTSTKVLDFMQIDTLLTGGYVFSYAHPETIGGGFEVVQLKAEDSLKTDILLRGGNRESIQYVQKKDSFIGVVRYDFAQNTLRTTFLYSIDLGKHWDTLKNSSRGLRKFLVINGGFFIEGDRGGTTHIFKADGNWQNWERVDFLSQGFKYISLVSSLDNNYILCEGSKSYNHRNNKLLLYDAEQKLFSDLFEIDSYNGYIKPITTDLSLHAIIKGDKIGLYSFHEHKMHLVGQFKKPRQTDNIQNLYVSDSLYIISSVGKELDGKALSWISYDKGDTWLPFYQDEQYRLVTNDFGSIIMIDKNNDVLHLKRLNRATIEPLVPLLTFIGGIGLDKSIENEIGKTIPATHYADKTKRIIKKKKCRKRL